MESEWSDADADADCRYGVRPSRHTPPRFARQRNSSVVSCSLTRDSVAGSHFLMNRSGGPVAEEPVEVTRNQAPWRTPREAFVEVKTKCRPGGRCLMPLKRGVVVKERRSMPARARSGRLRRRRVAAFDVSIFGRVAGERNVEVRCRLLLGVRKLNCPSPCCGHEWRISGHVGVDEKT